IAYTVVRGSTSACFRGALDFWLALIIVPLVMGAIGFAIAVTLLRPLRGKHLEQDLLTIGVAIVFADLVRACWGGEVLSLPAPRGLDGPNGVLGEAHRLHRR